MLYGLLRNMYNHSDKIGSFVIASPRCNYEFAIFSFQVPAFYAANTSTQAHNLVVWLVSIK